MQVNNGIELLDCTLRDGAYITDSHFGVPAMKGIIAGLQDAGCEIIECGWLKDKEHTDGSSFFHVPDDAIPYINSKDKNVIYAAMIDWDRYDTTALPKYDGRSIDAVRVVFPHGKHREGIEVGKAIRDKGYKVFFQAANTLAYSDEDLKDLAGCMNDFKPVSVSVVDTFGAMFEEDLDRILDVLCEHLDNDIKIGFHAHNNQQLAFSLSQHFIKRMKKEGRSCIVDSTLCGMGRGAGNTTTELITGYINKKHNGGYNLDAIMDAIDVYMQEFQEKYSWGYSTPYFIAGMYQCHVNNIAYLLNNHRTSAKDMRNIIASLSPEDRRKYDYDLLENKYLENQGRLIDDHDAKEELKKSFAGRNILLLCPGTSAIGKSDVIKDHITQNDSLLIGVNAIIDGYDYDYVFFSNHARYEYAKQVHANEFAKTKHIVLSNIKRDADENEYIIGFNSAIKRGWDHFDNAAICCLRIMDRLGLNEVSIAGFDGFKSKYNESYADTSLPSLNPDNKWDELNEEIKDIYADYIHSTKNIKKVNFVTESIFEVK